MTDIYTKQVLENLSRFIDDATILPSQVDISAATIQTTNTITPSITDPLTSMLTRGGTGAVTQLVTAGAGISASGTNTWQQNVNVVPVTESHAVLNLGALYRRAVGAISDEQFYSEYHLPRERKGDAFPIDPYWLRPPQCVLCESSAFVSAPAHTTKYLINPNLPKGWLYWTSDPGARRLPYMPANRDDLVYLGHFGSHGLYMSQSDYSTGEYLRHFVLAVLPHFEPAQSKPDPSGGGGGGAGGGGGGAGGGSGDRGGPRSHTYDEKVRPPVGIQN